MKEVLGWAGHLMPIPLKQGILIWWAAEESNVETKGKEGRRGKEEDEKGEEEGAGRGGQGRGGRSGGGGMVGL